MALKWTGKSKGALANSAVEQPKFSVKRLGQAIGLCSVVGATAMLSPAALALKTDFGMEYQATAFGTQSDAYNPNGGAKSDNGFAQLIRVKGNFLDENSGISVYTSVELSGDRWSGDNNTPVYGGTQTTANNAFNTANRGDNVRLDLGYVQIPVGHTIFRIGRQAASFNNCFLVCDDRRDRILVIQPLSKTATIVGGYDRRQDTYAYSATDNGDMGFLGYIGNISGWNTGVLYVKWGNNYSGTLGASPLPSPSGTYVLSNVDLFSAYTSGQIGPVKTTVGGNLVTDGNVKSGAGNDQFFTNRSTSAYLRLEGNAGPVGLGLQYVGSWDGGLISDGFNTWSDMINSSPESTANPTSMYHMGNALGVKNFNENLVIGKASYNFTPKWSVTGAVGSLKIDNGTNSDSSMVYNLNVAYQVNKGVKTWLSLGMLEKNDVGGLSGNSLEPVPGGAGSAPGGSTNWAKGNVKAASLNLSVDI